MFFTERRREMRDNGGHSTSAIFLSFLFGGLIGAGFGILLAPKSGREMRRQIRDLADETREKAYEYVDQAKDTVNSTVEKGRHLYEDQKSALNSAIEAGKAAYEREKKESIKGADA